MKLKLTIISILLICTLVTPAFGALGEKEYPRFFDEPWDHSPITVYIDDVNTPLHYSHTYRAAIVDATKYWENGGNGKLYYNPDFEIVDSPDADIYVMWVETMEEVTGADEGVAGYCRPEIAAGRFIASALCALIPILNATKQYRSRLIIWILGYKAAAESPNKD